MRTRALPTPVARFIDAFIDRLETLEILGLLLEQPSRRWTTEELTNQMRSSSTASKIALDSLVSGGLIEKEGDAFVFHAATIELGDAARSALDCYRNRRTAVIAAIYQKRRRG